jgi:hypothetical protein
MVLSLYLSFLRESTLHQVTLYMINRNIKITKPPRRNKPANKSPMQAQDMVTSNVKKKYT